MELDRDKLGLLDLDTVTSRPLLLVLELVLLEDEEEVSEAVTESKEAPSGRAAILASSSCSCCRALTNAAFNLLVCSALRAFLTLDVTHCSQITRTSFPANTTFIRIVQQSKVKGYSAADDDKFCESILF